MSHDTLDAELERRLNTAIKEMIPKLHPIEPSLHAAEDVVSDRIIDVHPPLIDIQPTPVRSRQRWLLPSVAAALTLVVAGLAVVRISREAPSGSNAAPATTDQAVISTTPAGLGVFPPGSADAVVAAGYITPEAVATAYLTDRTQPTNLPENYSASATVGQVRMLDESHALVTFALQTDSDGGDGLLQADRVTSSTGASGWMVASAAIGSFDVPSLSYAGGHLVGSFSVVSGGRTVVTVHDASTGQVLASSTFPLPSIQAEQGPAVQQLDFDGLRASAVTVRFWDIGTDYPMAIFAETVISDGTHDLAAGWTPLVQKLPTVLPHTDTSSKPNENIQGRLTVLGEGLVQLGYTLNDDAKTDPTTGLTHVTGADQTKTRTMALTITPGTVLQPENHDRVPITVLEQTDLLLRAEVDSNDGWRFEITLERTPSGDALPTVDAVQQLLYSIDP